ncbi:MAG: RNA polymerase sigma factor [Akkermansiaceae bacterium]|nr:RNA polymerase sigma factor [Armatimonadota bacterium]
MQTSDIPTLSSGTKTAQYERFVEPHRVQLRRHALSLTRNISEAEDLVQDTLIRAYTRLHLLRSEDSVAGWLATIQLNIFRNNLRRGDVLSRAHQSFDATFDMDTQGKILGGGTTVPDPETSTMRSEQNAMTIRALKGLPYPYRQVIILCDVRGESYQAIADLIGVPLGTVRSRIHRGRGFLRDCLTTWQQAP